MDGESRVQKLIAELKAGDTPPIYVAAKFADLSAPQDRDEAFNALIELLHDENPWFRLRAVFTLGKLADHRAVEPLIEALGEHVDEIGLTWTWELFEVLASFKDPRAIQPMIEQIHLVESKYTWDLFAFGDAAIQPMIDAIKHKNQDTRRKVAAWLGNARHDEAIPALVDATNDANEDVSRQAIMSLGWIGSSRAIRALKKLSKDPEKRQRAKEAIKCARKRKIDALLNHILPR